MGKDWLPSAGDRREFKARFVPHRTDDLRHAASGFVGQVLTWRYCWTAGDDEQFPGERVFEPVGLKWRDTYFGWVPERDLAPAEKAEA
jgi:hypothetical protein